MGGNDGVEVSRRDLLLGAGGAAAAAGAHAAGLGAIASAADAGAAARRARPRRRRHDPTSYRPGFETLEQEVRIPRLRVDGRLPRWLSGTLVRNGPARFEAGTRGFNHWFDGLAMLHAFRFSRGRVAYANRYLRTSQHEAVEREGKVRYNEFATDPCRSIYNGAVAMFDTGDVPNANVNVARLGERFVALTEVPMPVVFDPQTLDTMGVAHPQPDTQIGFAHPLTDPRTGVVHSFEVRLSAPTAYVLTRYRDGRRSVLAELPVREPAYIHSFAMTRSHLILAEYPLVVRPSDLLLNTRPFIENYRWEPERGTRYHVVDRHSGELRATLTGEAFFAFHHINAFEEGDRIHLDVVAFDDSSVIDELYLARLRGTVDRTAPGFGVRRYTLDPGSGGVTRSDLGAALELPRINYERAAGQRYRFVYGAGIRDERRSGFFDQVVKLDVEARRSRVWREAGSFPGEPVFVARPRARREDDGILLSVVLDGAARRSQLLVLDARDLHEIARASVPHAIPFGFHGQLFE